MATVTGLTAEEMVARSNNWDLVEEESDQLSGFYSQLEPRVTTLEYLLGQLTGAVGDLDGELDDLDNELDDLNDVVLPDLQDDLLQLQLEIDEALSLASDLSTQLDGLNATTLPGLDVALDDLSTELEATFGTVATDTVNARFPITNVDIGIDAVRAPNIEANAITAVKILADAVRAAHILAGEIQTNHMTVNTINGDRILVNTLHADKIIANTITANKLLVQGENLINDPGFESGGLSNHLVATGAWTAANVASGAHTGTRCLQYTLTGALAGATMITTGGDIATVSSATFHPKATPGDSFRVGFWVRAQSGSSFQARVKATVRKVALPTVDVITATSSYVAVAHATDWTFVFVEVTVPANADPNMYVVAQLQGTGGSTGHVILVDDIIARRRLDGSLVVDGTIYTQHMVANSISGSVITGETLNGDKIVGNSIYAERLAATLVMGTRIISGGTITGSKFQTALASSGSGGRMVINDDDEAGSIKGYFEVGAGWPSAPAQVPSGSTPVLINPKLTNPGLGTQRQVLYLSSGGIGGGIARIEIRSGRQNNTLTPEIYMDAPTLFPHLVTFQANAKVQAGQTLIYEAYTGGGGNQGATFNNAGALINGGSSALLKDDITPLELDDALKVLAMEPVSFRWRPEQQMGDDLQAGFIAEQADAVGADLWVIRNAKGVPKGIRYAEVTAAHNLIIQQLLDRIGRLEALVR